MSKLGDLPEGVESAMFLRDGWPDAVVCKVVMKGGCVGIGIYRRKQGRFPITPEFADGAAMTDAMQHVSAEPPDYSELHEHVAKMAARASPATAYQEERPGGEAGHDDEETDQDLQAALGQKAHD